MRGLKQGIILQTIVGVALLLSRPAVGELGGDATSPDVWFGGRTPADIYIKTPIQDCEECPGRQTVRYFLANVKSGHEVPISSCTYDFNEVILAAKWLRDKKPEFRAKADDFYLGASGTLPTEMDEPTYFDVLDAGLEKIDEMRAEKGVPHGLDSQGVCKRLNRVKAYQCLAAVDLQEAKPGFCL